MNQEIKIALTKIVADNFKNKYSNARYDVIYAEAMQWVNRLEAIETNDIEQLTLNLDEAERHIELVRRDLDAAAKLYDAGFNAWSIYITNKAVEHIAKAHSAIVNDVEAHVIGHRYIEWLIDILNEGSVRHLTKVLIAASGRQIGKNEIRNRLKKSHVLRSHLSQPETPVLWANAADVQSFLNTMDGLIDLCVERAEKAVTGTEIRNIIMQLKNVVMRLSDDPDELAAADYWLRIDPQHFKNLHIEQSLIYVRLMFLGLLLQPHSNKTRYFDEDEQAPTPFDYDRLGADLHKVPGIVDCLPRIRDAVIKTAEVTQQMIAHQRLTFLGSSIDETTHPNHATAHSLNPTFKRP